MSAEKHPEELIDRARRGGLAPEEQATLERHLGVCPVCAGQLSLAQRFERELAAQPRDHLLYQRAVEAAVGRMQRSPSIGRRRPLPRWSRWAAAAALLVFGVTGVAAVVRLARSPRHLPMPSPVPRAEPPKTSAPIPSVEPPPAEAPVPPESPPVHGFAHPEVTAEALFERAEKLRREGRAGAAIAIYRRLQAKFPATAEAHLSFALAGQLLLEQGRPGDALAQFDRHLSLGDQEKEQEAEVGEEALAGRATALEQLGRTSEAISAWKTLLARYPRSVYAERARSRLDQLTRQR
jgi:anti-sigma factor RsiW